MKRKKDKNSRGFTLIELMVTIMMASIVILAMGVILADSQRGWNRMYNRVFGEVATDGYVARKAFDMACRKSTAKRCEVGIDGDFVEVYYYQDMNSPDPDRYANFYQSGNELMLDYGTLETGTWNALSASSTTRLASNVRAVDFSADACCVRMVLRLDNGREALTVTSTAIRHN